MKSFWKWVRRLLLVTVLTIVAIVGYFFFIIGREKSRLDAVPLSPANYQPAGLELAKLCQSDPMFYERESVGYLDPFDPVWAPSSVSKLNTELLDVTADRARVFWGGGFYHCGWDLQHESGNTWTLYFMQENQRIKTLESITVPPDRKYPEDEYVRMVLAEIDRRLALGTGEGSSNVPTWYLSAGRCVFLEKHHRVDLLGAEVRKAALNYPTAWRDVLLWYLIDHRANDAVASERLRRWGTQTGGAGAWVYAAFDFFQAGEEMSGDDAIKAAKAITTADPEWIGEGMPAYEMGLALRLYQSGKMRECASLCEGILATQGQSTASGKAVKNLYDWAIAPATSRPTELPKYDAFTSFDPFGGFDLNLLQMTAPSSHL